MGHLLSMILKKISIINYKNIQEASLELSDKMNCFIGNNGEGKTNFLDAVYYLSFCKSAFNPIDSQVINHDKDFFLLNGSYVNENGEVEEISCGMKRGVKKQVKRNKKPYKRLAEHIGLVPLVFISPTDTALIDGGSDERRRLMDIVISQYDHQYMDSLIRYNKALQQRNALLRMDEEPDVSLLEMWELEMAKQGEVVYKARTAFVEELIPTFQNVYHAIAEDQETVSLRYVSHCQRGPLLEVIQRDRAKDRAVGYSLHGIHRDDLEMLIGDYQMKREGSQGQSKTFVLALKLAQFDFLKRTVSSTVPLLLLDDIFDKLDAKRVERIVSLVAGENYGQIFITDTNREHLDRILRHGNFDYKLFHVEQGDIKMIGERSDV